MTNPFTEIFLVDQVQEDPLQIASLIVSMAGLEIVRSRREAYLNHFTSRAITYHAVSAILRYIIPEIRQVTKYQCLQI